MKITLSQKDRKTLMDAGFPRQTINKWAHGAAPRKGNLAVIKLLIGKDFSPKKRKGNGRGK